MTKPKGRPPGQPKTGGREKGTGGRRLFVTLPKAQAERLQGYTDKELRALIVETLKNAKP